MSFLVLTFAVSLVIRSAFTGQQAALILSGNAKHNNVLLKEVMGQGIYTFVSQPTFPALLVHMDGDVSHKFFHYNTTMFRCLWGESMTVNDKVVVFRGMSEWIAAHNLTLDGNFAEPDDFIAWNTFQFGDGEFHYD